MPGVARKVADSIVITDLAHTESTTPLHGTRVSRGSARIALTNENVHSSFVR